LLPPKIGLNKLLLSTLTAGQLRRRLRFFYGRVKQINPSRLLRILVRGLSARHLRGAGVTHVQGKIKHLRRSVCGIRSESVWIKGLLSNDFDAMTTKRTFYSAVISAFVSGSRLYDVGFFSFERTEIVG
jgi:hypothetical protein